LQKSIGAGGCFGEIALIKNIPRTATVTAKKRSCLLTLSKEEFYQVLKYSLFTGIQIENVVADRLSALGKDLQTI